MSKKMTKMTKLCLLQIILIFLVCFEKLEAEGSMCGDWLPYSDEKCFKVIDDVTRTFDEAEKSCSKLENEPTLAIIHSKDEQDFLSNYLFKTLKKVDNFWIGARFVNNSFIWIDNSVLDYVNWDNSRGMKNKIDFCVEMQADEVVAGKWVGEPCGKVNKVVCQKMQTWSSARMQKEFLDERKQHRDALQNAIAESNKKITSLEDSLENMNKNPVPLGFIYVQLSNQPEPKTLWPAVQWKDVTSEYAGLFFRAEGGGAAQFGTVQAENAPKITQVKVEYLAMENSNDWWYTNVISGSWSSGIGVFSGYWNGGVGAYAHKFLQSGGEVRPRNIAMRVWKRIS